MGKRDKNLSRGASVAEYVMVMALIAVIVFSVGPLLMASARSLYSRNQGTYNTADSHPFFVPTNTQSGGTNNSLPGGGGQLP